MPSNFTRPTLGELIDRAQTDIEGALQGVNARLRRTVEFVFSRAMAGLTHGLHGHLAFIAEQILPDQAAELFLVRWAELFSVPRKEGVKAQGPLLVTGTGDTVPAGTVFIRPQDGAEYTVDATVGPISGSEPVQLTALLVGSDFNESAGASFSLEAPISGISSIAVVDTGGITLGANLETLPELLVRFLAVIQKAPLGGAPGDHELFALEVPGVTRAFEFAGVDGVGNPGIGKVSLTFVRDNDTPTIIPDAAEVQQVQDELNKRSPAEAIVFPPDPIDFDFTVELSPNTPEVQAAVDIEVADLIAREGEPGEPILFSHLNEAVSGAAGEADHNITFPVGDVLHDFGEIPVFGISTYLPLP